MSEPLRRRGRRQDDDPVVRDAEEVVRLALAEELDTLRLDREWSIERAARTAGIAENTLSHLLRTTRSPDLTSLVRLAAAFGRRLVISFE